jgi:hypothetical protein
MSTRHCPAPFSLLFRICDRGVGIRTGEYVWETGRSAGACYDTVVSRRSTPRTGGGGSVHYYRLSAVSARQCSEADPPTPHPPSPPAYIWAVCSDIYRLSVTMVIQAGESRGYSDAPCSWSVTLYEAGPVILCCFYFICLTPAGLEVWQNVNCWGCSTLLLYWGIMSRTERVHIARPFFRICQTCVLP